jgi:ABC-type Mn2+/Zn2+ transport system permease subunit
MEMFGYTFMQHALLEAVIIGALCAVIGVYVVLNSLSFIGAGISHAAFGGIALGILIGVDPVLSALLFCVGVALSIGAVSERGALKHDTAVGIFFASTMALGVVLISLQKGYVLDLFSYMFGNILAITKGDLLLSAVTALVIFAVVIALWKEFLAMSFDRELAHVMGLPARGLYYLLLVLMSVTIVISMKSVGIVLVSALLVTPAASAHQLTKTFGGMMALSLAFGVGSSVAGLILSYMVNIPSGACIVLVATTVFFLSWLLSPRRRRRQSLSRPARIQALARRAHAPE